MYSRLEEEKNYRATEQRRFQNQKEIAHYIKKWLQIEVKIMKPNSIFERVEVDR